MNKMVDIGDEEIEALLANLDNMAPEELEEIEVMVEELANRKENQAAYDDLIAFCRKMQPDYICLLYTSPSPRDGLLSRMPSSA